LKLSVVAVVAQAAVAVCKANQAAQALMLLKHY
jgi:hypothetical protein